MKTAPVQSLISLLRSRKFRDSGSRLDGYDADAAGDIVPVDTLLTPGQ